MGSGRRLQRHAPRDGRFIAGGPNRLALPQQRSGQTIEMDGDCPALRLVGRRRRHHERHGTDTGQVDLRQRDRCAGAVCERDRHRNALIGFLRHAVRQIAVRHDDGRRPQLERVLGRDRRHAVRTAIRVRGAQLHHALRRVTRARGRRVGPPHGQSRGRRLRGIGETHDVGHHRGGLLVGECGMRRHRDDAPPHAGSAGADLVAETLGRGGVAPVLARDVAVRGADRFAPHLMARKAVTGFDQSPPLIDGTPRRSLREILRAHPDPPAGNPAAAQCSVLPVGHAYRVAHRHIGEEERRVAADEIDGHRGRLVARDDLDRGRAG